MTGRLVLLVVCGLSLAASRCGCSQISPESVCSDQFVPLERISQARRLIEENAQHPVASCDKHKGSMSELLGILEVVQTGHICNLDLVHKIRNYHMRYIATSDVERDAATAASSIPTSLKHFFIALCFQISAECKMGLINNLEYDTRDKISEHDYEQIKLLEKYGATLLDDDMQLRDFDDLLLLSDLQDAAGNEQDAVEETRLVIKVKTNNVLRQLMNVCQRKFRPFYNKLIMPLIKLSNLGYNYQGEMLERELEELRQSQLVKRWYNIVQTCEAFGVIKIFEDPDMVIDSDGEARQMITFIGEEEASLLKGQNLHPINEQSDDGPAKLEYWPPASHNVDELWIKNQAELASLVERYKTSATEVDRLKARLMRKMVAKIKALLKSGHVVMLMSEIARCTRHQSCQAQKTNVNEDMIMMMDDVVQMDEVARGTAVEPSDRPVAGKTRQMVSKVGPAYRSLAADKVPPKVSYLPRYRDGTKKSTRFFNWTSKILPTRLTMLMWILAILGLLMLVMGVVMAG